MAITLSKEKALVEDLELGFGVTDQPRGGNKFNASFLPFTETKTVEEAINERPTRGEASNIYAAREGDASQEFLVGYGDSPNRAVKKTELDNAPYAPEAGNASQTFNVADATQDTHATNRTVVLGMISDGTTQFALKANVLEKDNTSFYQPSQQYHPATKAYVDAKTLSVLTYQGQDTLENILAKTPEPGHAWQTTTAGAMPDGTPVAEGDIIAADVNSNWTNMGPIQGPQGEQGPQGDAATIQIGTVTGVPAGTPPTVINSGTEHEAIFDFELEQGEQGPQGLQGPQGIQGPQGDVGPEGPEGPEGPQGTAATLNVGTTTTGAEGTDAQVTNSGDENDAIFDFVIPRGDKGPEGPEGPAGPEGPQGPAGMGIYPQGERTVDEINNLTGDPNIGDAYMMEDDGEITYGATPVTVVADDWIVWTDDSAFHNEGPMQGPAGVDGKGWTGGSYDESTGIVEFTSDDGLGFTTGDLRGADGADGAQGPEGPQGPAGSDGADGADGADGQGWTAGYYTPETGIVTFDSDDGLGFSTTDLRGADGAQGPEGPEGPQGPEGPVGPEGPEGPAGIQGPEGPTATSADAGNTVTLGSDSLLYQPRAGATVDGSLRVRVDGANLYITNDGSDA